MIVKYSKEETDTILTNSKIKCVGDKQFIWHNGKCYELSVPIYAYDVDVGLREDVSIYEHNVYGAKLTEDEHGNRFSLMVFRSDG